MASSRYGFKALLTKINPSSDRLKLAKRLPGEVREWLQEHDFVTAWPHTRLSGSYARSTAVLNIKDVDVLLFVPEDQLDRTPNSLLREVKSLLDDYPDAFAETAPQRRSVLIDLIETREPPLQHCGASPCSDSLSSDGHPQCAWDREAA